jgi:glycosyltransferase involved in cell wall biosynthesis
VTLGAFVVVRDGARMITPVVTCLQQFADQVLVIVDNASVDDTLSVAEEAGARTLNMAVGGSYEHALNVAVDTLNTDWVFYLHDDELVNRTFIDRLPRMMNEERAWKFPHYNLWPDARHYISSSPHYLDAQLRLIPRAMWIANSGWPEHVHASPAWPTLISTCHIWHYKFLLKSQFMRAQRLATWSTMYPPAANAHYRAFSIVEDLDVTTEPVPEPAPRQEAGYGLAD